MNNETGDGVQTPVAPDEPKPFTPDSYSRQKFLKLMGGVGAAGAFGVILSACGADDDGSTSTSGRRTQTDEASTSTSTTSDNNDLAIVNYALTLEYLEADFYAKVIESGLFKGKELDLIKLFGEHEQTHVDALKSVAESMGEAAAKPETTFPLESREAVLELAATVENLGASAYLGQAGLIKDKEILASALAIHTVEARHAAALNFLIKKPFVPDGAFAVPASMEEVLPKIKPFIAA
jgi:hypothetical protein